MIRNQVRYGVFGVGGRGRPGGVTVVDKTIAHELACVIEVMACIPSMMSIARGSCSSLDGSI